VLEPRQGVQLNIVFALSPDLLNYVHSLQFLEGTTRTSISDIGTKNGGTFFKYSQVGIGSESDCLLGQLERIVDISDSVAGLKSRSLEVELGEKMSVERLG